MLSERAASNAVAHPPPAQPVAHQVAIVLAAAPVAAVALALRAPAAVILPPVVKADDALVGRILVHACARPAFGKPMPCFVSKFTFGMLSTSDAAGIQQVEIVPVLAFSNTNGFR